MGYILVKRRAVPNEEHPVGDSVSSLVQCNADLGLKNIEPSDQSGWKRFPGCGQELLWHPLIIALTFAGLDVSRQASAFEWTTDAATNQGMCVSATIPGLCTNKLDALKVRQTGDLIVIRNDRIIF